MKTITNPNRWWDLPAAALLVVAIITAATRLFVTHWTDHLQVIQTVAFLGVISGLALGQSRFSPRTAAVFAIVYGVFTVPWQLGLTMGRGVEWSVRMLSLANRLNVVVTQLINQEVVQDSILFLFLMSALFWILSVHAGYTLTRNGQSWRAILPTGLALFAIHSFDAVISRRAWYLAVYLFFALVLVARMAYLQQHTRWQHSRTALPPHLGLDFIRFTLLAAAFLVLFSWTAPALANTIPAAEKAFLKIKQPWNEMRDRVDNAFASLRSSVGVVSDYYGASVLLGRGNRLTDSQVFVVRPPAETPSEVRYYWRAKAYDMYDDQWFNTAGTSRAFNPQEDEFTPINETGRWLAPFEFLTATYVSTLFSPSQTIWVSRPAQAELSRNEDGSTDVIAFRATPPLSPGQSYSVQAYVSNATASQMRESGTTYPEWVTDRYLQLPDSITDRTRQLAEDITVGLETPYDKVVAITSYLRDNITYSETIPNRPSRQEAVDWFLFDLRQGFCNYYASAEVILLRSLGIPARWAVGYAQGERLEDGSYLVRQRDAHAWPEVYFPGIGWVEFEPTAAQPILLHQPGEGSGSLTGEEQGQLTAEELARQQLQEELEALREDRLLGLPSAPQQNSMNVLYWAIPLVLAAVSLFFAWRWRERLNFQAIPIVMEASFLKAGLRPPRFIRLWAQRAALDPLSKAYLEINGALNRLGRKPAATDTPAERAFTLGSLIPPAEEPARRLVGEYQIATFSPQPADTNAARKAGMDIRKLSYKALLQRWLARLQKPPRRYDAWVARKNRKL